jgi:hypothetical protein
LIAQQRQLGKRVRGYNRGMRCVKTGVLTFGL